MHNITGGVTEIFAQSHSYVVNGNLYDGHSEFIFYSSSQNNEPKVIRQFQFSCRIVQSYHERFSFKVRIGIGMLFAIVAKAVAAIVETVRQNAAIEQGFEDQPNAEINMSALWLVPEFVLFGFAEAFTPVGLVEFFYCFFPKSMSRLCSH